MADLFYTQSTVLPGAVIGDNVILNPASVVSGRSPMIPSFSHWGGSPAKKIKFIDQPLEAEPSAKASTPLDIAVDLGIPCAAVVGAGICIVCSAVPALGFIAAIETSLTREVSHTRRFFLL